jgi:hypothetical protein
MASETTKKKQKDKMEQTPILFRVGDGITRTTQKTKKEGAKLPLC